MRQKLTVIPKLKQVRAASYYPSAIRHAKHWLHTISPHMQITLYVNLLARCETFLTSKLCHDGIFAVTLTGLEVCLRRSLFSGGAWR
jgi:hypothetical protein